MSIITQYTKQFVDRISELENENNQLKQKVDVSPGLKADFDSLTERHIELKKSYAEIERENTKMRQDMDHLIAQQSSLHSDVAKYFQQVFSDFVPKHTEQVKTPKKTCCVKIPSALPSQKPIYREAKATTKLLNTEYESDSSDSETDDESSKFVPRKLRFDVCADPNKSFDNQTGAEPIKLNLSEILPKDEESSDDEKSDYETILKQIITEGLMSGLENINRSPHHATQLNSTRPDSRIGKRHRHYSTRKNNKHSMNVHPQSHSTARVRPVKTENTEQNTNPFKFNFMFTPQGFNHNGQGHTSPIAHAQTNQSQPHSQEAQLVQKILESLFTPNK